MKIYYWSFILLNCMVNIVFFLNCSLLLRRESCSFSNGEFIKAGLGELESWCRNSTEEVTFEFLLFYIWKQKDGTYWPIYFFVQHVGAAWKELKHIRQAVEFLVYYLQPLLANLSLFFKYSNFTWKATFLYFWPNRLLIKSRERH